MVGPAFVAVLPVAAKGEEVDVEDCTIALLDWERAIIGALPSLAGSRRRGPEQRDVSCASCMKRELGHTLQA